MTFRNWRSDANSEIERSGNGPLCNLCFAFWASKLSAGREFTEARIAREIVSD